MQDTIEGYVEHIIYRNEDNGYTVLNLMVKGKETTCVGIFEYVGEGSLLNFTADFLSLPPLDNNSKRIPLRQRSRKTPSPWNDIWAPAP